MYSAHLTELFHSRAHAGNLPEATHAGEAGTRGQGPYIRLWLRVEDAVVVQARFKTYGCPAAIGCAEAVCAWSEGQELHRLGEMTAAQVTSWVDGVPEGKEHCPELAAEAARSIQRLSSSTGMDA